MIEEIITECVGNVPELKYIKLIDKNFNKPGCIDLLLSTEIFYELLQSI